MVFNIEVNNETIQARKGETILNVLKRNGIMVPTLCNMKAFSPTGACRMCIVEVEGRENLLPSCSCLVEEWMKIKTHSPRVLRARKTIVELLLSNHPDDCLYCERNGNCELQKLAEDLNIRERRIPGSKSRYKTDKSGISIIRDPSKCLLCGRCVRICEEQQAVSSLDFVRRGSDLQVSTAMDKAVNFSNCINCGQCLNSCPTGALTERVQFTELEQILFDRRKKIVVQYSPTLALAVSEVFGIKTSQNTQGILNTLFRKTGFDAVFETSFASDLLIDKQAEEFIERWKNGNDLPMITSCCPSWVKYAEQSMPGLFPNLSVLKSPQQIMGSAIKNYYASHFGIKPEDIFSVSISPCTAMKYEAQKPENTSRGLPDVDLVLTLREFVRMVKLNGIDIEQLSPEPADEFMGSMTSAGKLGSVSGGSLEGLVRTIYFKLTGEELETMRLSKLRTNRLIKELVLKTGERELRLAAVSTISEAYRLLELVKAGKKEYDLIEVMACPSGCINGGGQIFTQDEDRLRNRARGIYEYDGREAVKSAHKNLSLLKLYADFEGEEGRERFKSLFTTTFSKKEVLL